ncbi:hypothetical protein C8A00DRAFT_32802 [Chaetomidium leptoderma]|uniref:Uncharacterized protein n=1 Tax=Chaetomidium leptoderma TaxID=669021 RepID=A0AAN6VNC8_9PEZI|nr:hypothetical protein C8A00DRAFT_32802 [Chaetomidium leptoderma]
MRTQVLDVPALQEYGDLLLPIVSRDRCKPTGCVFSVQVAPSHSCVARIKRAALNRLACGPRLAVFSDEVNICAVVNQEPDERSLAHMIHGSRMAAKCGGSKRVTKVPRHKSEIHICPGLNEKPHTVLGTSSRSRSQRAAVAGIDLAVDIRTSLDEHLHTVRLHPISGCCKRAPSFPGGGLDEGAAIEQYSYAIDVAPKRGFIEGHEQSHPVVVLPWKPNSVPHPMN